MGLLLAAAKDSSAVGMAAIAVVVFGVLVVTLFLRSLVRDPGRHRRAVFGFSHRVDRDAVPAHGARHLAARHPRDPAGTPASEKVRQLQRLRDKGHISDEDFRRTVGDLMSHERTAR